MPTDNPSLKARFESYMRAQFGDNPPEKTSRQYLAMEDSFYSGANSCFARITLPMHIKNNGAWVESVLLLTQAELEDFGANLLQRYIDAGYLPK
jgi:hypothetical protein